jgi:hypothetical protein
MDLDDPTRKMMGQALRTTYELDAPMPDHLAQLMQQLEQRLQERSKDQASATDTPSS